MRIAVVTTSFPRHADDGAGHFVLAEAQELARAGHDVTVFAPNTSDSHQVDSADPTLCVEWIADGGACGWPGALARLRSDPLLALGLCRFSGVAALRLRAGRFDRVVAHWLVPSAFPIAAGANAPVEAVAHGSDVRLLLAWPWLRWLVVRRLLATGAQVRFVSHALRDELTAVEPALARVSFVQASPVDTSGTAEHAAARAAVGINDAVRLVVIVARLVAGKRVDVALRAASLLPRSRTVVVGDGPERQALEAGFPDARFVGQVSHRQALTWISAADLVVSASRDEGAPTVVREARALGVPVVATPSGDLVRWADADPGISVVSAHPR